MIKGQLKGNILLLYLILGVQNSPSVPDIGIETKHWVVWHSSNKRFCFKNGWVSGLYILRLFFVDTNKSNENFWIYRWVKCSFVIFQWLEQISRRHWRKDRDVCLLYDNIFGKYYKRVLSWVAIDSRYDGTYACKFNVTYKYDILVWLIQYEFHP